MRVAEVFSREVLAIGIRKRGIRLQKTVPDRKKKPQGQSPLINQTTTTKNIKMSSHVQKTNERGERHSSREKHEIVSLTSRWLGDLRRPRAEPLQPDFT